MFDRIAVVSLLVLGAPAAAQELPFVEAVEAQPLAAQARRVAEALALAGAPLERERDTKLHAATRAADGAEVVRGIQEVLDPLCLAMVYVNPESRVEAVRGPAATELVQGGWRVFLVKVHNEAGVTSVLRCESPNAELPYVGSSNEPEPEARVAEAAVRDRWLALDVVERRPLARELSGLEVEYRLILLYSRDAGRREAQLVFDVGQGTRDLGHRAELDVLFDCIPATPVTLRVLDVDGSPTVASFVVRDAQGRVYPARSRRLEPDFFFHDQVYRADGDVIGLPPGTYAVRCARGPEYRVLERTLVIPSGVPDEPLEEVFELQRWIHLAARGWYSGDHHVHAAGCSHYDAPSQGVGPEAMLRHVIGEDLNVGCVLTWGPCWYHQKRNFEGRTSELSTAQNLLRYDVEVSGFPSSDSGHLCLLRLGEDDYPGTERIEDWPSWDLPVLQWAKEQGGIVGFAHSGWGLQIRDTELPSLEMPPFDGIGANEYVVDVTHGAVDFISAVDTPAVWELNIWYHTLNAGYETRISGETDFPCIYGERVGMGRSYVRLDEGMPLNFDDWVRGLRAGRSYVSDGMSHLPDFEVGGLAVGAPGANDRASVLAARTGEALRVRARVAALLPKERRGNIRERDLGERPFWHLERARLGDSRHVPVELVVNGRAIARQEVVADGSLRDIAFEFTPEISSWVSLRILPSSHTNPVFVELDDRPIRASRSSAEWCAKAVETCWNSKWRSIRKTERAAARAAYDFAAAAYRERMAEAEAD